MPANSWEHCKVKASDKHAIDQHGLAGWEAYGVIEDYYGDVHIYMKRKVE